MTEEQSDIAEARAAMRRHDRAHDYRPHDDLGLWIVAAVIMALALWIASCLPATTH